MSGWKYRVRCIGRNVWGTVDGHARVVEQRPACGWTGVRSDHIDCECYDINSLYCRPFTPGPGCPRGIDWPCPRCKGAVTGVPVKHREVAADAPA